jgi:hypothetical protein
MAAIPESTRTSLTQRLNARGRDKWPQIEHVNTRFHGAFAYVTACVADGDQLPLMRLRYGGSARIWGFAIYRASHDDYEDSWLPDGQSAGTPETALDTACGLYLDERLDLNPRRTNKDAH